MIKNGKIWPIMIALSIFGVVLLSYWTLKETARADLSQSDLYMDSYQNVDENINKLINQRIAFDKNYHIEYNIVDYSPDNFTLSYTITPTSGNTLEDVTLELVFSRPINDAEDIVQKEYKQDGNKFVYAALKLPKEGRWNLALRVKVKKYTRFFNLIVDTRKHKAKPFNGF